jgi:hypothetical protein
MTQQERNKQIALMLGWKYSFAHKVDQYGYYQTVDRYSTPYRNTFDEQALEYQSDKNAFAVEDLQFHSDWSWVMEAVEFIENLKFNNTVCTNAPVIVDIKQKSCYIYISADIDKDTKLPKNGKYYYWSTGKLPIFSETKKEAIFIAVSNFAKLYNEEKL